MTVEFPEAGNLPADAVVGPPPTPIAISVSVDMNGAATTNYLCSHETMVKTLRTIADDIEKTYIGDPDAAQCP